MKAITKASAGKTGRSEIETQTWSALSLLGIKERKKKWSHFPDSVIIVCIFLTLILLKIIIFNNTN